MAKINKAPTGATKAKGITIAQTDGNVVFKSNTQISDLAGGHTQLHAMTSATDHSATAWRIFYTNASGEVVELDLGSSAQVLTSNGLSAAPSWQAGGGGGASAIDDLTDVDTTTNAPTLGDSLIWDGTNWVTNLTQLIKQVDDVAGTTIYIGEAQPGTATSAAAWRIKRIVFTGDDSETLYEDGDVNFDNEWTGRAAGAYS